MTFFLRRDNQATPIPPGPDFEPQSWSAGMSATAEKTMLERDANLRLSRERTDEAARLTQEVMPLLDSTALLDRLKQKGIVPEVQEAITPEALRYNRKAQAEILAMAREEAEAMPVGKWNGVDLSEEGVDARVNARLRAEYADLEATIAMSPVGTVGSMAAQLAGGVLDVRNLAVVTPGIGGPGVMAAILRGASVNAAAEAAFLPSQFEMADRLNIQAPDVLSTLAMAAAGGAILDGGITAAGKAIGYFAGRNAVPDLPDVEPVRAAAAVEAAEEALASGRSLDEAVAEVIPPVTQEAPVAPAPEAREPLVPAEPAVAADPFERIANPASPEEIAATQDAVDMARAADVKWSRPLSQWIKSSGPPTRAQLQKAGREGRTLKAREDYRIDPNGPLGQELRARGISAKTYPGLFVKGGRGDLDNLVASEMEDEFPGIMDATGTAYGETYLNYDGLRELLIRDAQGDGSWLRSRADLQAAQSAALDAENPNRTVSALDQYRGKERADDGFFVDLNEYEFDDPNASRLDGDFDAWAARRSLTFTPDERAELLAELRRSGGDAEFLVERQAVRNRDEVANELNGARAASGADRGLGQADEIPWDNPGEPRQAGTLEGERAIAAGTAPDPVTAEALTLRSKVFDDPTSTEAQAFLDSMVRDLQDEADLDVEGMGLVTDEGTPITTKEALLREIEENDTLAREIELCRTGTPNDPQ